MFGSYGGKIIKQLFPHIETSIKLTASWGMAAGEAQEWEGRAIFMAIAFGSYISLTLSKHLLFGQMLFQEAFSSIWGSQAE